MISEVDRAKNMLIDVIIISEVEIIVCGKVYANDPVVTARVVATKVRSTFLVSVFAVIFYDHFEYCDKI